MNKQFEENLRGYLKEYYGDDFNWKIFKFEDFEDLSAVYGIGVVNKEDQSKVDMIPIYGNDTLNKIKTRVSNRTYVMMS